MLNLNEIKNEDILFKVNLIIKKYSSVEDILNSSCSNEKKQQQIEEYCIDSLKKIKANSIKYQLYYINIPKLKEKLLSKKELKTEKLIKIINYIDYLDIIVINSFSKSFYNNNFESIGFTKILTSIFEDLHKHCNFMLKANNMEKNLDEATKKDIEKNLKKILEYFQNDDDKDILKLIHIILEECEKNNIIKIKMIREKIKTKKMIFLEESFIFKIFENLIGITNLPMVKKPNDWSIKNCEFTNFGGYLYNFFQKNIQLIHFNRNRSRSNTLREIFIDIINNIQEQKFRVDIEELNKFLNLEDFFSKLKFSKENQEYIDHKFFLVKNKKEYQENKIKELEGIATLDKKKFKNEYDIILKKIINLIETLYIANLFKNYTIYFPIYNDFRNRLYYHSNPFNIQTSKLTRNLICFKGYTNEDLISLDATASGIQILACVLKNKKLLQLTNLLNENHQDIYEYYRELFNNSSLNHLSKVIKTKKNKEIEMTQQYFIFEERKLFKKLLMTYMYNKETFSMAKDIEDSGQYPDFERTERYYHMQNLLKFFQEEFKDIEQFKSLINDIIDLKMDDIELNQNSNYISTQFYAKYKIKRVRYYLDGKQISVSLKKDIIPPQLDKRKSKKATMPNFIHNIDADILYQMIKKAIEKNIPIFTIHDCFVVPKKYSDVIKENYLEILNDLVNQNVLENFVKTNIKEKEEQDKLFLKYKDLFKKEKITLNNLKGLKEESLKYDYKL